MKSCAAVWQSTTVGLSFLNIAPLDNVVRMYAVENFSTDTVRAFHGHRIEEKTVFVVSGSAIVVVAEMDESAVKLGTPTRHVLSGRSPQLLRVPAGYANGFRALEPSTKILFFSSTTLEQAKTDDYRFPADYFGNDIWKAENR